MPQQRQFRIQLTFSFPPAEITLFECIMIPLGFQCPAPSYLRTPSQGHKNRIPSAICRTGMRSISLMKSSKRKNLETEVSRFLELLGGFEPPTSSLPSAVGYAPSGKRLLSIENTVHFRVPKIETTSGFAICTASLMHF